VGGRNATRRPSSGSLSSKSDNGKPVRGGAGLRSKDVERGSKGQGGGRGTSYQSDGVIPCSGCGGHFPAMLMETHIESCRAEGGERESEGRSVAGRSHRSVVHLPNADDDDSAPYIKQRSPVNRRASDDDDQDNFHHHHSTTTNYHNGTEHRVVHAEPVTVFRSTGNAYLDELNKQIEDKKHRKEQQKKEEEEWNRKKDIEISQYEPYGKSSGGGGPMRDEDGNVLTDLRHRHNVITNPNHRSPVNGNCNSIGGPQYKESPIPRSHVTTPVSKNRDKIMGSSISFGGEENMSVIRGNAANAARELKNVKSPTLPHVNNGHGATISPYSNGNDVPNSAISPPTYGHGSHAKFMNSNNNNNGGSALRVGGSKSAMDAVSYSYSDSGENMRQENEELKRENKSLREQLESTQELLAVYRTKFGRLGHH
jgi:hypothetical protein